MKKIFVLLAIVILALPSFAQKTFTIKGDVTSLKTGDKVFLRFVEQNKFDSVVVNDGKFEFKGVANQPVEAVLSKNTKSFSSDRVNLFVEPGDIVIQSAGPLKTATITGTPTNMDYTVLNDALKPYQDKLQAIKKESTKFTKAQLEDQKILDSIVSSVLKVLEETNSAQLAFVNSHPESFISVIALTQAVRDLAKLSITNEKLFADVEASYLKLNNDIKSTEKGKELDALIKQAKKTSVGVLAMDFSQNDPYGKAVKLSDFKGKYILLDFWASWCVPCRLETPNLINAFNKYKNKNFTILSVSIDKEKEKEAWLKAIKDDGMVWTNVSDLNPTRNHVAEAWNIEMIPATFLIDPAGKIIAVNLRGEKLQKMLDKIF